MAYNSKLSTPQIEQALGAALLNEKNQYNITQDKGSNYSTLAEAIAAVSDDKYKVKGIVLTYNTGEEWVSKRYNGEDASGFSDEGNWIDIGGVGSSTHTLDLSPLFDEEGSPVATVSDEFLAEVKKAYDEKYSNAISPKFGNAIIPMLIAVEENVVYDIILTYITPKGKNINLNTEIYFVHLTEKAATNETFSQTFIRNGSGTKALTDNGQYAEFAKPAKMEDGGSGTVTKELQPNILYKFGECASLTITLAAESAGLENEYKFEFVSGSTPTALSLPDSVKWSGGSAPTMEASKTYQVSIVNNLAVYAAF